MNVWRKSLFVGVIIAMCIPVLVKAGQPDQRLIAKLDAAKLNYKVLKDGDIKLMVTLSNDRTQLIFIESDTEKLGTMEIREVWSCGFKGNLTAAIMRNMLHHSEKLKIGAWGINGDEDRAIFTAKIPANLDAQSLRRIVFLVGESADDLENDVTGKDDL